MDMENHVKNRSKIIPQNIVEKMSDADRKELKLKTYSEKSDALESQSEKKLQRDIENWLKICGYWPRSPAFLDGKVPPNGWFFHVYSAKKNPILLDLIIMHNDGRYIEVELKTKTGRLRPDQSAILNSPHRFVVRSFEEMAELLKEFENEKT